MFQMRSLRSASLELVTESCSPEREYRTSSASWIRRACWIGPWISCRFLRASQACFAVVIFAPLIKSCSALTDLLDMKARMALSFIFQLRWARGSDEMSGHTEVPSRWPSRPWDTLRHSRRFRLHSCQLDLFLSRRSDVKRLVTMGIVFMDGSVATIGCTMICETDAITGGFDVC